MPKLLVKKGSKSSYVNIPKSVLEGLKLAGFSIKDIVPLKNKKNKNIKQICNYCGKNCNRECSKYDHLERLSGSEDQKQIIFHFKDDEKLYFDFPTLKFQNKNGKRISTPHMAFSNRINEFVDNIKEAWVKCFFKFLLSSFDVHYFSQLTVNKKLISSVEKLSKLNFFQEFIINGGDHLRNFTSESTTRSLFSSREIINLNLNDFKNKYEWILKNMFRECTNCNTIGFESFAVCYKKFKDKQLFKYAFDNYGYCIGAEIEEESKYIDKLVHLGYEPKRLMDYICRDLLNQGFYSYDLEDALTMLRDYAQMNVKMKVDNFEKYPRYLATYHHITVKNYNSLGDKALKEKFKKSVEKFKRYEYQNEIYIVIAPKSFDDLTKEGNSLNHCVASYAEDVANKETIIMFLRKKPSIDMPFVTIELNGNKIIQAKGKNNSYPKSEEAKFLKEYFNFLQNMKK